MQRLRRGQVKGDAEEVKEEVAVVALERVAAAEADGVSVDPLERVPAADCSLDRDAAAETESAAVDVPDRVDTTEFDGE